MKVNKVIIVLGIIVLMCISFAFVVRGSDGSIGETTSSAHYTVPNISPTSTTQEETQTTNDEDIIGGFVTPAVGFGETTKIENHNYSIMSINENYAKYECDSCGDIVYIKTCDLYDAWNSAAYVNKDSNNMCDLEFLDVVDDGVINVRDFALIYKNY